MENRFLNKLTLLLFLGYFVIVGIILGFSYSYYAQVYENEFSFYKTKNEQQVNAVKKRIITTIDSIVMEVLTTRDYSVLREYIESPSEQSEENLANEFLSIVKYRKKYDQIGFIGIDGYEKVRINYNLGSPEVVKKNLLQNKSDSYYFQDMISLEKDDIYISKFDLNSEFGRIEFPRKPVIRIGVPVYFNDKIAGVLIFNYLAEELLYSLHDGGLGDSISYLYNSDGYLLKGLDPDGEWGFMFEDRQENTLRVQNPSLWTDINSVKNGFVENENGLYVISTINPEENIVNKEVCACGFWKLVTFTPNSVLRLESSQALYYLVIINVSIILAFLAILWMLARFIFYKQVSEGKILELNDTLKVINKILRHDLANAFTSVSLTLDIHERSLKNKEFVSSVREIIAGGKNIIHHMKELEGMVSLGESLKFKSLDEILERIIKKYKIIIELRGSASAHCDDAIETVFENIISNALRHGRTRKIQITLKKMKDNVRIEFADFGKGVPSEIEKSIFNEGFKYGKYANTGLGLYIVKKTISRYGGEVYVKKNKPKGAIFVVKMPQ
ncbi:HAMP domain-containing histidine kinase [Patescibacteria group bacterium]|nr:HAMP domain-containing histidine kinase [Patescibacteria group bacterium]